MDSQVAASAEAIADVIDFKKAVSQRSPALKNIRGWAEQLDFEGVASVDTFHLPSSEDRVERLTVVLHAGGYLSAAMMAANPAKREYPTELFYNLNRLRHHLTEPYARGEINLAPNEVLALAVARVTNTAGNPMDFVFRDDFKLAQLPESNLADHLRDESLEPDRWARELLFPSLARGCKRADWNALQGLPEVMVIHLPQGSLDDPAVKGLLRRALHLSYGWNGRSLTTKRSLDTDQLREMLTGTTDPAAKPTATDPATTEPQAHVDPEPAS